MKYILVGGNPFRGYRGTTTFTSLKVVASCQTKDEARQLWNQHYDDCGGLMIIIDAETGQPADMNSGESETGKPVVVAPPWNCQEPERDLLKEIQEREHVPTYEGS